MRETKGEIERKRDYACGELE